MLRLIRGGAMATDAEPLTVSAESDPPVMTPGLARVFASIFQRLLEQRSTQEHHDETAA